MEELKGKIVGNIDITVYQDENGEKFFELQADSEETLPVLDILEDRLSTY